jgi:hypothetical protein
VVALSASLVVDNSERGITGRSSTTSGDDAGRKDLCVPLNARGKARELGFGLAKGVTLTQARELRDRYRKMPREGVDPKQDRDVGRAKLAVDPA